MSGRSATGGAGGRPAKIDREQIVAAALASDDLDELTMRELAGRLEVSHSALYRWVRNRDEVLDLVSPVLVDRALGDAGARGADGREWLTTLASALRQHFLAAPGFVTHLARPHRHHADAYGGLRAEIVSAFGDLGADDAMAEQSYLVYITSLIAWVAAEEHPTDHGGLTPRFDLFVAALLRGLPTRE
ncbi:TetR/AcrR family transcriptional regulator [Williamsia sp. SKLECPSW1]